MIIESRTMQVRVAVSMAGSVRTAPTGGALTVHTTCL
jgi:hypothetical protein